MANGLQWYKKDNGKSILEIVDVFEIDKIKLGFRSYDKTKEKGSRTTGYVDFYMNISDFELLCHNILQGCISKKLKAGQQIDNLYGGTIKDGEVISRILSITRADAVKGIYLTALAGPGKKTNTGGYTPLYEFGNAPNKAGAALNPDEMKKFALCGLRACDKYYREFFGETTNTAPSEISHNNKTSSNKQEEELEDMGDIDW